MTVTTIGAGSPREKSRFAPAPFFRLTMGLGSPFSGNAASRKAIATEIERLISLLDAIDGDCDLEDDDPAGGNPDDVGEVPDWLPRFPLPVYGIDQRRGPTNAREHWRAQILHDREG